MKKVIYIIEDLTTYNIHYNYRYQDPKLIDNKIHKRYSFFYFSFLNKVVPLVRSRLPLVSSGITNYFQFFKFASRLKVVQAVH